MKFSMHLVLIVLVMVACGSPSGKSGSEDSVASASRDTSVSSSPEHWAVEPLDSTTFPPVDINYDMAKVYARGIKHFEPFERVYERALAAYKVRDSLYYLHQESFTAEDSAAFGPVFKMAYEAILNYKDRLKTGLKTNKVKIPSRASDLDANDQSHKLLRKSNSMTLSSADFGFLGAAPFVEKRPAVFKGPGGNPEIQFSIQIPENAWYFFDYVYAFHPGAIDITYGPPLSAYEGPPSEINGIGSLVHNLTERIPVWILTTNGAVPGSLVRVMMKLGADYGCVSENPTCTFVCSKDIDPNAIFGVFYAGDGLSLSNATSTVVSNRLWEYDIDGDGEADLARINSTFEGISDDTMAYAIWFVKVDGGWVALDYGAEPDCT